MKWIIAWVAVIGMIAWVYSMFQEQNEKWDEMMEKHCKGKTETDSDNERKAAVNE